MRRRKTWPRWPAAVLTAALAASSGCVSCLHPVAPISKELAAANAALPEVCRNHVYIFLIDGEDPLDVANLGGVRDALIALGYIKTYCGEYHHYGYFKDEILRIHRRDGSARFVVMGFSLGANAAADLAEAVRPDGVTIDLLAYCGGLAPADNVRLSDVCHFGSPTSPYTMESLAGELAVVASRVTVTDLRPAAAPLPGLIPPPDVAAARKNMPRDEWDFLKPTSPNPPPTPKPAPPDMPKAQ